MVTRDFPGIARPVSLLGFGLMRLPLRSEDTKDIDYVRGFAMVDAALAAGVNYFDTAWPYHQEKSEDFIGQALCRHPRESFLLADKIPTWLVKNEEDVERIFTEQLRRCRVDYFDFYLIHALNAERWGVNCANTDIYGLLARKKEQGLIKHLGFSFHDTPELLEEIADAHPWDFAQIQLNYIDWDVCEAKRQYAILSERKIPVIVMEPLRGGALAVLSDKAAAMLREANPDVSVASWALRYAASLPGVLTVLSGMSAEDQVADNVRTISGFTPLNQAEREVLGKAADAYRAAGTVPCTGCRYCMDCPVGVDIPRVFGIYNHFCTTGNRIHFGNEYRSLAPTEQAAACVACAACVSQCPQGIDIPARMREVVAAVSD